MTRPLRASRRTYNRLNSDSSSALTQEHDLNQNEHLNSNDGDDEKEHIEISILDSAHAKFSVPASPDWSVLHFKKVGATVHKVPPRAQRLIHMGKLLKDDQTLRFYGIDKPGTIVHLFPKPNVVVLADTDSNTTDTNASNVDVDVDSHTASNNATPTPTPNTGAHVPQIVLDAQEAERRSQILILSSNEIFEAQHKVRLLSFLLLIICAMELLTLFTVLIGVPTDQPNPDGTQHDDFFSPTDPADQSDPTQLRTWQNTDYADLAVSAFGFYVATLGIKASTENTARLAKQYFYCLLLAGISWNAYYYMLSLKAQEARQQAHDNKDTDTDDQDYNDDAAPAPAPAPDNPNSANPNVYTQALLGILIPMCVWITCFLRAWQFHQLILEAELEAEQRAIANDEEMNRNMDTETALDMDMNVDEHEHEEQARGSQNRDTQSLNISIRRGDHSPVPYGTVDQDLVLQVDHGTIT